MVSIYPISQEYNLTHTFDDDSEYEDECYKLKVKNTTGSYLENSKKFTLFIKILKKAGIYSKLYEEQFEHTLFAVPDFELVKKYPLSFFDKMGKNEAINIINFSMLNVIINKKILKKSPISFFTTINKYNKLCVMNINNKTILNKKINIIHFNHLENNGIIHIVDDLLIPDIFL